MSEKTWRLDEGWEEKLLDGREGDADVRYDDHGRRRISRVARTYGAAYQRIEGDSEAWRVLAQLESGQFVYGYWMNCLEPRCGCGEDLDWFLLDGRTHEEAAWKMPHEWRLLICGEKGP